MSIFHFFDHHREENVIYQKSFNLARHTQPYYLELIDEFFPQRIVKW